MPKYKVKNATLLHNGKAKTTGDVIELTELQAKKLAPYVEAVEETSKDKTPATKTETTKTETTKTTKTSKGTKTQKEETTPAEDKKDETQKDGDNN